MDQLVTVVNGVLAAASLLVSLVLLLRSDRFELSLRTVGALLVAAINLWSLTCSLKGEVNAAAAVLTAAIAAIFAILVIELRQPAEARPRWVSTAWELFHD